jgi:hypothetical protein
MGFLSSKLRFGPCFAELLCPFSLFSSGLE